jgi:hypothetical protein
MCDFESRIYRSSSSRAHPSAITRFVNCPFDSLCCTAALESATASRGWTRSVTDALLSSNAIEAAASCSWSHPKERRATPNCPFGPDARICNTRHSTWLKDKNQTGSARSSNGSKQNEARYFDVVALAGPTFDSEKGVEPDSGERRCRCDQTAPALCRHSRRAWCMGDGSHINHLPRLQ